MTYESSDERPNGREDQLPIGMSLAALLQRKRKQLIGRYSTDRKEMVMRHRHSILTMACAAALIGSGSVFAQAIPPDGGTAAPFLQSSERELPAGLAKASNLVGADVTSATGEEIGDIKDLVLDHETGTIRYVVLSTGGFLGIGDTLSAVPWKMLRVSAEADDPNDKHFVLEVDRQRLGKAPRIEDDTWPTVAAVEAAWGVERQAAKPLPAEHTAPNDSARDDNPDVDRDFNEGTIER